MKTKELLAVVLALCMAFGFCGGLAVPENIQAAAKIKLSSTKKTLYAGKSFTLKVTGTKGKITWKSSDESVATVTSKGKVTAKKAGTATITATVGKKKLTCKVTVKEKISNSLTGYYERVDVNSDEVSTAFDSTLYSFRVNEVDEYGLTVIDFGYTNSNGDFGSAYCDGEDFLDKPLSYTWCTGDLNRDTYGTVTFTKAGDKKIKVVLTFDESKGGGECTYNYVKVKDLKY